LTFINSFNVYYNIRRLVIGIYQLLIVFKYSNNRAYNTNIFPITLGPYSSNFKAIVEVLKYITLFKKGVIININNKLILISVFTLYYIRDILQ
ncbi:hypothetical protein QBC45DRAFT_330019, partial [Copromyces sp. CBS 386.78]